MDRFTGNKKISDSGGGRGVAATLAIFAAILLLFVFMMGRINSGSTVHSRKMLEQTINRDITICYAEEGSYPADIEYLEENYGLAYDDDRFSVHYQVRGSNIRPYVSVVEKGGGDQ
jgi:hypothetical protein